MTPQARTRMLRLAQLDAETKLLLMCLADYLAEDDDWAWPAVSTLVLDTGLSERTVQRRLLAAIAGGYLEERTQRGTSSAYRVVWEALPAPTPRPRPGERGSPRQPDTPRHADTPVTLTPPVRETPHPRQPDTPPPSEGHPTPVSLTPDPTMDPTSDPTREQKPARRARGVFVVSDEAGRLWARWADHHPTAREAGPTQQGLRLIGQALRRHTEEQLAAVVDWVHGGTDARARWLQREGHTSLHQVFASDLLDERVELAARGGRGVPAVVDDAWVDEEVDRQFTDLAEGMSRSGCASEDIAAAREDLRRKVRRQAGMEARG